MPGTVITENVIVINCFMKEAHEYNQLRISRAKDEINIHDT